MISVIIPCFNSEKFIERAINSVLKQTYTDYEIIIVDNNSSDNTLSIINAYKNNYPQTIKILQENKKGAPCARNKGLNDSKGDWIQFLDSDDELLPEKLNEQMNRANNSAFDVIVGSSYIYKCIDTKKHTSIRIPEEDNVWKSLLTSKLGITSANLWRREAVLAVCGWDENKNSSQEYDLLFRMLKNNSCIGFCSRPLTIININPNSISNSQNENRIVEILQNSISLRLDIKKYLESKNALTKEINRAADMHIYNSLIAYSSMITIYFKRGVIPSYVRKALKEIPLDLPLSFLTKLFIKRTITKLKNIVTLKFLIALFICKNLFFLT